MSGDSRYNKYFFHGLSSGSAQSAERIVPLASQLLGQPNSVLDVGSGTGAWLSEWLNVGVTDVVGVDGEYVDRRSLMFPADKFIAHDLATSLDLGRRFDLVSTVEVAEHIPAVAADVFVASLVRHSDVVLFSAAIPGQGGTGHINEQYPSYWAAKFAIHGYEGYDVFRAQLWNDRGIEIWYRQNLMAFARPDAAERLGISSSPRPIDLVHPELFAAVSRAPLRVQARQYLLDSPVGPLARAGKALLRPR